MTEENITTETPQEETQEEAPRPDIAAELQEFGQQLAAATKAVLASPEAQEAKVQLQRGLDSLSKTLSQLTDQARETKMGQKVETGVSEASATLKEKRVLETLSDSVASALHSVNQAMGQAVEKAEKRAEAKSVKKGPKQIEVVGTEMEEEEEVQAWR